MPDQISFKELLQDPLFKAWTMKPPKLQSVARTTAPWFMYVHFDGRWRRKEFETYPKAFNALVKRVREGDAADGAIHCKRQWFSPPVVKTGDGKKTYWPMPPGHRWCGLCRRPTVLQFFSKHHAMPGLPIIPYELRCTICGARSSMAPREYPSILRSRFA